MFFLLIGALKNITNHSIRNLRISSNTRTKGLFNIGVESNLCMYNDHPWDPKNVAVVDRWWWSLFQVIFSINLENVAQKLRSL